MSKQQTSKKDIHKVIAALDIEEKQKKESHDFLKSLSDKEFDSLNGSIETVVDELIKRGIIPPKTSRKQAESITKGKTEPKHLGKQTSETLDQELLSLKNAKPAFRDGKWEKRFNYVEAEINQVKDERTKQGLINRLKAIRGGEI